MKLTDIDTSIYYPVMIPSCKKATTFKPFRVREEKALLTAEESGDSSVILSTIESVVRSCVKDCPQELTTFDVEYLMVQLRTKSIGEISDISLECPKCKKDIPIQVDLTKTIVTEGIDPMIKLNDELTVYMRYPSIGRVADLVLDAKDNDAIASCIKSVYFKDEVFHTDDGDLAEVVEFVLNRTDKEMEKIVEFINKIPTVELSVTYKCPSCTHEDTLVIRTLADFF